ncbi:MAG: heavy-metal-associated domain-containing protein [Phycisphaerae bacterium]|nr:heavy-metal-associated domain-containing protein [Phycisphaerae bacterium]
MRCMIIPVVLLGAASLLACDGGRSASAAEASKVVIPAAYTKSFSVKGMHCDGCAKTVTKKVKAVEGVVDCTVDLKGERATVTMDDAKRTQAVIDAITKLGYEVAPIDDPAPTPAPATPPATPPAI